MKSKMLKLYYHKETGEALSAKSLRQAIKFFKRIYAGSPSLVCNKRTIAFYCFQD